MLTKYLSGESDLRHLSKKLFELGYSIDWLYGEIGMMVHNQENTGRDLSYLSNFDIEMQKERIKIWIENTFRSISKFEEATELEPGIVSKFIFSDDVMNYEIFRTLKNEGCNLLWTFTGIGKKFLDNRPGQRNYIKYLELKNKKS